jgi:hypothetical protein
MHLDPRDKSRMEEKALWGWSGLNADYFIEQAYAKGGRGGGHLHIGDDYCLTLNSERDFLEAYIKCGPLKSIVGKRALAFNTGKRKVVKADDKKTRVNNAATKAIEKLLKKPNILQREAQFIAQMNIYIDIFGYCPMLRMTPAAMDFEISQIWNIPPWLFDIEYTRKWLKQNEVNQIYQAYWIEWEGKKIELSSKDLFFVFDEASIGTQFDTNLTIPDSRLIGQDWAVSNIIASMKSLNTLITKRGAIGILSNEGKDRAGVIPMEEGEKDELQKDFRKYGIVGQPYQIIITNATLKWQQIGFATKDLMLFEGIEDAINSLCDAYDWSPLLMARGKGSSMNGNDRKEAQKQVYRDSIIPGAESRYEQLAEGIIAVDPETLGGLTIIADFSEVEVLQEDKKILAETDEIRLRTLTAMYLQGFYTKNEVLVKMGEQPRDDASFNEYYKPPVEKPVPSKKDLSRFVAMFKNISK